MQFLDFKGLSEFLKGLFGKFSEIGHKHTISDITDYKVDTALSSNSTNPLQNKVINEEFDAVSEAMGALEAAIDEKLDTSTASSTYETKEDAQLKYDEITDAKADWNQNDENAIDYVKNRTHWVDTEMVVIMPEQTFTIGRKFSGYYRSKEIPSVNLTVGTTYIAVLNGKKYECVAFSFDDGSDNIYLGTAEGLGLGYFNDYPFQIRGDGIKQPLVWVSTEGEIVTFAIYEEREVIKQLDEKFIPDSIARTSDIKNIDLSSYETTENAQTKYDNAIAHSDANLETAKNYADTVASGKADSSHTHTIANVTNLQSSLDAKVPTSRTINGKALTGNITLSASDVGADASGSANSALASSKSYTDSKVSGLASTTVVDNKVGTHNTSTSAHSDIRDLITGLTTRLNALADSDDTTLDQMSEIVAYIKANKTLIESITTSKINVSDIVNNLTTNSTSKVLSAAQGVAIKALIDALETELDEFEEITLSEIQTYFNS